MHSVLYSHIYSTDPSFAARDILACHLLSKGQLLRDGLQSGEVEAFAQRCCQGTGLGGGEQLAAVLAAAVPAHTRC